MDPKKDEEHTNVRINPFAFGAAGYVMGGMEAKSYSNLALKYKNNGISLFSYKDIIGTDTSVDYSNKKKALDNLIHPSKNEKPLLVVDAQGNITPSEHFGILS